MASLLASGEAQDAMSPVRDVLRGDTRLGAVGPRLKTKPEISEQRGVVGDRMVGRFDRMKQGDLLGQDGVHRPSRRTRNG